MTSNNGFRLKSLFMTRFGPLDVLATIEQGQSYDDLIDHTIEIEFRGHVIRVLDLEMLVELKKETELRGAELWLTRLHKPVYDALEQGGVLREIGLENVRPRILGSTIDYLLRTGPDTLKDMPNVEEEVDLLLEVGNLVLSQSTGERRQELEELTQKLAELKLMLKG